MDDAVITAFNDSGPRYATAGAPLLCAPTALALDRLGLAPGRDVVDLACGPGTIALPAAREVGAGGSVTGVDLAERQLEIARRDAPHGPSVRFQRRDASALGLPDRSADAVACGLGLPYFREPLRALREAVRVARPGAPVVWTAWGAPWLGLPGERFRAVLTRNDVPPPLPALVHTPESLARLAFRAGLDDVVIEEHEIDYAYPSFDAWWEMLRAFALLVSVDAVKVAPPPDLSPLLDAPPDPPPPIRDQLRDDPALADAGGAVGGRMGLLLLRGTA